MGVQGTSTLVDGPTQMAPDRAFSTAPRRDAEGAGSDELWAGRYAIERLLGEGDRKQVYLARDLIVDREVALALIEAEDRLECGLTLTQWESRVTAKLVNHPHVVTIYDVGEHDGYTYMVSQYMAGGDLRGVLKRARADGSPLPLATALRYASEICQALEYSHAHGVIHRDIQPGNVWFAEPDGAAHLGDFDLALADGAPFELSDPQIMVTTRGYLPPEEVRGEQVDARSDLYSLGAVLYELLVGRPPFEGTREEVVAQHLTATPKPPALLREDLPPQLNTLVLRLLSKSPEDRPQSAAEVLEALAAVAHSLSTNQTEVAELISRGESGRLEFKASLRYAYKTGEKNLALQKVVAKSIAGLMNSAGGVLLIGVHDDGSIAGIEADFQTLKSKPDRDGWELALTQAIETYLGHDAAGAIALEFVGEPEGTVAVVHCPARSKPTWLTDGDAQTFFIRVCNSTRPLPAAFAQTYIAQTWPR
jgi:serine/threonine protein kinase